MLDLKLHQTDPKLLNPVALAFVGDGVLELLVREQLVQNGSLPPGKLHNLAVKKVNASAQAKTYSALEEVLTPGELSILKRGRNSSSLRSPKSCSPIDYRKSTAIEALFGYLYLKGEMERLHHLFGVMDAAMEVQE